MDRGTVHMSTLRRDGGLRTHRQGARSVLRSNLRYLLKHGHISDKEFRSWMSRLSVRGGGLPDRIHQGNLEQVRKLWPVTRE